MSGGGKGGDQLVGYWYAVGMHMVLSNDRVDELARIMVGDRIAWSGSVTSNQRLYINQPELFGGESREGGIQGNVDIMFGDANQPCNDYLVARCGGGPAIGDPNAPPLANGLRVGSDGKVYLPDGTPLNGYNLPTGAGGGAGVSGFIPAFRGVLSVVLRQVWVAAMNPYIKPWSFLVRRYPKVLGTEFSKIGTDANPAAIIAECLLNSDWGLGYQSSALDIPSFQAAAATLKSEGFGMSLPWTKQKSVDEFIGHILSTVDGYRYTDPTNGRIGIRLARNDYDRDSLLVLDDTNIDTIQQFARPDPSDVINQVTVTFVERPSWGEKDDKGNPTGQTILKNVDRSITVHSGASIEMVGQINATSVDYPGIPNIQIAARVAMRELGARTRGLATVKFVANRTAAQLKGGDVFKLNWPPLGISGMVLRVTEVDYGLLTDGRITISAVEDAFNLPNTTYVGGSGSAWVEPAEDVKQIANSVLFEAPYYVVATTASDNDTALASLPVGYAFLGVVAARQQNQATNYSIWQKLSGVYVEDAKGGYTPYGTLDAAIDDITDTLTVTWMDLTNYVPNSYAFLGSEIVWITSINNKTVKVVRGVMDTVPVAHDAGETLWLAGGTAALDQKTVFLSGQNVPVKLQPRTPSQVMALSTVVERTIRFVGRAQRPYPPGNIKINNVYRPKKVMGPMTISWATRNRLTQTGGPVAQTDGNIAAEANTTYNVTIKQRVDSSAAWSTIETTTGITGTSYTPTNTPACTQVRIEISARRDGLDSFQSQILEFDYAGYGVGYGNYYGGV
ncbi:tail assembly protein [Burkholderia phage vB_BceS_AH2]|uniref:Tail assembly protein n=1 Tax=Burkholderia phage vB_BceS_AH2 TaxID=1133022 RepID=I6NLI8_9CAUD|nr:tail protein [Burkholderia phage vB_BceS_AH2]AEY69555.1 tail assembly protein [Burkholderia phage vB_BceS_AH2]